MMASLYSTSDPRTARGAAGWKEQGRGGAMDTTTDHQYHRGEAPRKKKKRCTVQWIRLSLIRSTAEQVHHKKGDEVNNRTTRQDTN